MDELTVRADNVERITLNGKPMYAFTGWKWVESEHAWRYAGRHYADLRSTKSDRLQIVRNAALQGTS
jgi:hypothetical protein